MFSFEKLVAGPVLERTGFSARAGSSGVQMLKGRVWAEDVVLENPATYPEPAFLDIASLTADIRWRLGRQTFDVGSAAARIRRITGVRTRDGRINFAHFHEGIEGSRSMSRTDRRNRETMLKTLSLNLEEVEIIDYQAGEPDCRIFSLGFNETWKKISLRDAALVLLSALSDAGLSREDAIFASILPERIWTDLFGKSVTRPANLETE